MGARLLLVAATAAAVIGVVVAWRSLAVHAPLVQPGAVPAPPASPTAGVVADAALAATVAGDGSERAVAATAAAPARQLATPAHDVVSPAAAALLAAAKGDPKLLAVTAEVVALDSVEVASSDGGQLVHQDVQLRWLAGEVAIAMRRYATVTAPLCPAHSEAKYGCSTPLGVLAVGQVRPFVLARGRPDLGAFGALFAEGSLWIVVAGPEVARPDDPILAAVPEPLVHYVGRPRTNVFRGRVRELRSRAAVPAAGVAPTVSDELRAADRIVVDVTQIAHQGGLPVLRDRVRIGQVPFTPGIDLTGLTVGGDYWFATDDVTWWQAVLAWAPVR
jgi:hypothetical protein